MERIIMTLPSPGVNPPCATIDTEANPVLARNCELLKEKWPEIWPAMFTALKTIIDEYGYSDALVSNMAKLRIDPPFDEPYSDEAEWCIVLEFEPFAGIYDLVLFGWNHIEDSGATF